jgi:hypothetical protein
MVVHRTMLTMTHADSTPIMLAVKPATDFSTDGYDRKRRLPDSKNPSILHDASPRLGLDTYEHLSAYQLQKKWRTKCIFYDAADTDIDQDTQRVTINIGRLCQNECRRRKLQYQI